MKPIIGITSYDIESENVHRVSKNFIDAIIKSGGVPVIIPSIKKEEDYDIYLDTVDGLVFTGGEDVFPGHYGEDPLDETKFISIDRDESEINLFKRAYKRKMSILGICRGLQIMNVALGGNLYQDIPTQIENANGHRSDIEALNDIYHSINIVEDTMMKEIFKEQEVFVNSYHHQSIKDLGKQLKVSSYSKDGVIESVENMEDRFLLGVQFHPERLYTKYPEHLNMFERFIDSI